MPYRDGLREGDPETSPQVRQNDVEARGGVDGIVEQAREWSEGSHDYKEQPESFQPPALPSHPASLPSQRPPFAPSTSNPDLKDVGAITEVELAPLISDDTPFFHLDLQEAVRAAERRVPGYQ